MKPESDSLQGVLNKDGSEKHRYSAAELLAPGTEFKIYRETLTAPYPLHWLEFYEMFLVLRGKGVHAVNGRSHRLKPGTLCLLTPADFHAVQLSPGEEITLSGVMFDEKLLDENLRRWLFQTGPGADDLLAGVGDVGLGVELSLGVNAALNFALAHGLNNGRRAG